MLIDQIHNLINTPESIMLPSVGDKVAITEQPKH
jgi:hypothetical protein